MYKNLRIVPHIVFGRGAFNQLDNILSGKRTDAGAHVVFLIDDIHESKPLIHRVPLHANDLVILVNVDHEPKTTYVDQLTEQIKAYSNRQPEAVVGIGGGSTMDLAKAISIMLNNPGTSADYQGWDLVKYPSVYSVCIPTLSGTGAEVSRTTVLTGPVRKLGINSDYTPFDQVIMDPDLLAGVPRNQWFFTGMDCYIHNAEALNGTFMNAFARAYAEKSLELCRDVYFHKVDEQEAEERLMIASYFGGLSIGYSQVGVCHALSYGLSYLLGVHHGVGNCIVFDQLEEYYGDFVQEFRKMMQVNQISLPQQVTAEVDEAGFEKMIDVALSLEPLWENALGTEWKSIMTREKARELYEKM